MRGYVLFGKAQIITDSLLWYLFAYCYSPIAVVRRLHVRVLEKAKNRKELDNWGKKQFIALRRRKKRTHFSGTDEEKEKSGSTSDVAHSAVSKPNALVARGLVVSGLGSRS